MTEPAPETRLNMQITPEVEAGHYANFVSLWHSSDEFTFDFGVISRPPQPAEDEAGHPYIDVLARIVARVRVPPGQVFEIMKALEQQLSAWEKETGKTPPQPD
jgi:hypothetical protein